MTALTVRVVGGSNQISAYLIPALLLAGHRVEVYSRRSPPIWLPPTANMQWMEGPRGLGRSRDSAVDALVYLAPLDQFSKLSGALCAASRVVVFSSTSATSKLDSGDLGERALASALEQGERQISEQTRGANATLAILRPTLIYGAGLDQNLTRLARFLARWRMMPLLGAASGKRQPVHAEDLAQTALQLVQGPRPVEGTYDLPGGSILSYREMVRKVFESLQISPRFISVPTPLVRSVLPLMNRTRRWRDLNLAMLDRMNQHLVYDYTPAVRDFGYEPRPFMPQASTWLPLDQQKGL
ncbi:MAG: NAD-dependent epimerase/dehydratase family protein [Lysobacterales bacterium]